jgi:hypothetical protein
MHKLDAQIALLRFRASQMMYSFIDEAFIFENLDVYEASFRVKM